MKDFTTKKKEYLLKTSEARYRRLFETAQDGIMILDAETGQIEDVNSYMIHMIGYTKEDFIGKTLLEVGLFEDIKMNEKMFIEVKSNGYVHYYDVPLKIKNGREIPVEFLSSLYLVNNVKAIQCSFRDITNKMLREETESPDLDKRCFNAVAESTDDLKNRTVRNGKIMWIDPGVQDITGYTIEECLQMDNFPLAIVHQEDLERIKTHFEDMPEDSTINGVECRIWCKNSNAKQVSLSWQPVYDDRGINHGQRVIVRDIADRKRMEQEIRESENKFKDLAEKSLVGVYLVQDEKFKYVNAKFAEISGYTREEIIDGKGPGDVVFHEDWPIMEDSLRKRISGEIESIHYEFRMITKKHEVRNVEIYSNSTIYEGKPAVIGTLLDITERKQSEKALRTSYDFLKIAQQAAHAGFWEWDMLTERHTWSEELYRLFGLDTAIEASVGNWLDVLHADDRKPVMMEIEQSIKERRPIEIEYRIICPDGQERWISAIGNTLYDGNGQAQRLCGICIDITSRKHSEKRVQELNRELEQRIVELKNINMELEILSYSVSHDLRTPLFALEGFARILMEKHAHLLDAKGQHFLGIIYKSAKRMAELIGDLLEFFSVGRKTMDHTTTDMEKLVKDIEADFKTIFPDQEFHIDLKTLPLAQGDRKMLRQVFVNLIDNAIKYSKPKGSVVIEIGGIFEGGENIYYVKDNGIGFSGDQTEKVFEIFERLHGPDKFKGTGIGLAIVKRIVEKHGGKVWAEGRPGDGATFYFSLPVTG